MVYLNKILPVFLLPTGLAIICLAAALILRRWALCGVGLAILWLGSTPLVGEAAIRWVEGGRTRLTMAEAPQADAIVVLSGVLVDPPGDNDVLEWSDAVDRFEGGLALFQAGKAGNLVFTRGQVPWRAKARPEGEVLAEWAVQRGIPQSTILLTEPVANTAAEAQAVAALLAEQADGAHTILLVTSAFHMRRAILLFEEAGLIVEPFPVDFRRDEGADFTILNLLPNASTLAATELALREFYGYLFYRLLP